MKQKDNKLIVITGCDSGIGKSLASVFLKLGYSVALSYLDQNHFEGEPNAYAQKMDLLKPDEVEEFCAYVKNICEEGISLQAVVTNSGIALGGPVENIPMDFYRKSFEVNFFGAVQVIKAFIPELIRNKGRIMIIGSMAGKVALPYMSAYASTKFALEGFCDSLRREMNPFGIKTIIVEHGGIATPIWNKAKSQDVSFVDEKYLESLNKFRENFLEAGNHGMDVELAAYDTAKALISKKPKARYIIAGNRLVSKIESITPDVIIDMAVKKMFKMDYGKKA
ncbi:MAG: SDR family NAD(P)-dependent oxidoreductase [Clostridiaceae bacterium]